MSLASNAEVSYAVHQQHVMFVLSGVGIGGLYVIWHMHN